MDWKKQRKKYVFKNKQVVLCFFSCSFKNTLENFHVDNIVVFILVQTQDFAQDFLIFHSENKRIKCDQNSQTASKLHNIFVGANN